MENFLRNAKPGAFSLTIVESYWHCKSFSLSAISTFIGRGDVNALWQFLLFGMVGGANCLLDVALFNLLTGRLFGMSRITANTIAVSCAITSSFVLNSTMVFHWDRPWNPPVILRFLLVTFFAGYIVQNSVIALLSYRWTWPARMAQSIINGHLNRGWAEVVDRNLVKLVAVGAAMFGNFFGYKWFVFPA